MDKVAAIITRHWKALLGLNVVVLAATVASMVTAPRSWTASAQLILPDNSSRLDANLGTLGSLQNGDSVFSSTINPLKVQASILTSEVLLQRALAVDPEKDKLSLRSYASLVKVVPQDQTTLFAVSVDGSSPDIAKQRAELLLKTYQQRLNELRQANSTAREQFSQKEVEQARNKLRQVQLQLAEFKEATGLVNSDAQTSGLVTTMNTLMAAQAQAVAQAQASAKRAGVLSDRLGMTPDQAMRSLGLGENQDYQFLRQKLIELEASLVQARSRYTDQHPTVQKMLAQRADLQSRIQQYIGKASGGDSSLDPTVTTSAQGRANLIQQLIQAESEASGQQRQAQQLQSQVAQLGALLRGLPRDQARLAELQRQADVAEGVYKGLVAQVQQSNIDAFNAYPNVQVLDPPRVDARPTSPKRSITLINGLLASLLGSLALILLLETRNPLLNPKDLQAIKFPLVVRIPRLRQPRLSVSPGVETEVEFQRLASSISLQALPDRRLLVTSAIMGEGKTTVTLGLAIALVDLGFRVLMVDGDFRQAALSHRLGYAHGLLSGDQPVSIQPGLDLVPTAPKHGKIVDLVTRGRFEHTLAAAQATHDYDYVLIDSAPVSLTSETALMATVTPNVLFVVRPGSSDRNSVNDSLDQLTQHHARVMGLVVNGVEAKSRAYPYRANALVNS